MKRTPTTSAAAADLFANVEQTDAEYSARDIEVLEGLEPVRRRPAMFIGGTDERALHHLVAELLDNAMDEAVAGHASRIELELLADGTAIVRDNGRGIPIDRHPKFKGQTALEVILTTLHAGAKFGSKAYHVAGGLHGVGLSVVNALAEHLVVEVVRDKTLWRQSFSRGKPSEPLVNSGMAAKRRGTTVSFRADPDIFASTSFRPGILYRMARSKAYLHRGIEIGWKCSADLLVDNDSVPSSDVLHFPGGLQDFLATAIGSRPTTTPQPFAGTAQFADHGKVEWAVAWPEDGDGFFNSYCNTIPTPEGGTHETGFRTAIVKGLKAYGQLIRNREAEKIVPQDALDGACVILSVFLPQPEFQGQTKERLTSASATRLVETSVRDHFDHWLAATPDAANSLVSSIIERAEERLRRREDRRVKRQAPTRKLRLPGKLTDCVREDAAGTELFIVEGDSAGGSAKQARIRETQAILPLRGKILNVASASSDRLRANQELNNLIEALGCGTGTRYDPLALRYEKVIIMTDADVDGAHIASLLLTFFFRELPELIAGGHLYLAVPPLYRMSRGSLSVYARDDAHREELMATRFGGRGEVEISRFKGLGEMPADQLRKTTMNPETRTLLRVVLGGAGASSSHHDDAALIESLMGRRPEKRFSFIVERARFVDELDI